ncbi:TylF/MycF/NovP-related O-methyltransferase [Niveispirillum lacus]|nr:TylF/MycF/NovP-related O-methyltransferase [Niveispirillum lacus]
MNYDMWFQNTFKTYRPRPNTFPAMSWTLQDPWGQIVNNAMVDAEKKFTSTLLKELNEKEIIGDIIEFGVFSGGWMEFLINESEALSSRRLIHGLDSFMGLPEPDADVDLNCWKKGDYAADFATVSARLRVSERPHVRLYRGWFSDTLPTPPLQSITKIAFARIDCDLYGPTVECLDYLKSRLVDGAILVFDDWTFDLAKGETKALYEGLQNWPGVRLEFLCFTSIGHIYFRVHRES